MCIQNKLRHDGSGTHTLLVEIYIGTIFLERNLGINFKKLKSCEVLCHILADIKSEE